MVHVFHRYVGILATLLPVFPAISHPFLSAFVRIRTFRPAALFASASASTFLASVLIDHTVSLPLSLSLSSSPGRGKLTRRDRRCPRVPLATSSDLHCRFVVRRGGFILRRLGRPTSLNLKGFSLPRETSTRRTVKTACRVAV